MLCTDICPRLSVQQLYRLSTLYWDDKYNTETVTRQVQMQLRQAMQQSRGGMTAFLLDDTGGQLIAADTIDDIAHTLNIDISLALPDQAKLLSAAAAAAAGGGGGTDHQTPHAFAFLAKSLV